LYFKSGSVYNPNNDNSKVFVFNGTVSTTEVTWRRLRWGDEVRVWKQAVPACLTLLFRVGPEQRENENLF
jgi:hypothetical protein